MGCCGSKPLDEENIHDSRQHTRSVPSKQWTTGNGLTITCYVGDVTRANAEALVTGEGRGMLKPSVVTNSLCDRAQINYNDLRAHVYNQYGTLDLDTGGVYVVETDRCRIRLPFSVVFLAVMSHFRNGDEGSWKRRTENLYAKVLHEADKRGLKSVAVPLLGSGHAGAPSRLAADALLQSLFRFQPTYVRDVLVVSFDDNADALILECCRLLWEGQHANVAGRETGKARSRHGPQNDNSAVDDVSRENRRSMAGGVSVSEGAVRDLSEIHLEEEPRMSQQPLYSRSAHRVLDAKAEGPEQGWVSISGDDKANVRTMSHGVDRQGWFSSDDDKANVRTMSHDVGRQGWFSSDDDKANVRTMSHGVDRQGWFSSDDDKANVRTMSHGVDRQGWFSSDDDKANVRTMSHGVDKQGWVSSDDKANVRTMSHGVDRQGWVSGDDKANVRTMSHGVDRQGWVSSDDKANVRTMSHGVDKQGWVSSDDKANVRTMSHGVDRQGWVSGDDKANVRTMSHGVDRQGWVSSDDKANVRTMSHGVDRQGWVSSDDKANVRTMSRGVDRQGWFSGDDKANNVRTTSRGVVSSELSTSIQNREEYVTTNALAVVCYMGDVTQADAEGIVIAEGRGMLKPGMVTKALCEIAKISYEELRSSVYSKYGTLDLKSGRVYFVDTGSSDIVLQFKVIFLAAVWRFRDGDSAEMWSRNMEQLYTQILYEADKRGLNSVAIPLLGSGKAGAPLEPAVNALLESLARFTPGCLKSVLVVSFQEQFHAEIVRRCRKHLSYAPNTKQNAEVDNTRGREFKETYDASETFVTASEIQTVMYKEAFKKEETTVGNGKYVSEICSSALRVVPNLAHQTQDSLHTEENTRPSHSEQQAMPRRNRPTSASENNSVLSRGAVSSDLSASSVAFCKKEYVTKKSLVVTCYIGDVTDADAEGVVTGEGFGMTNASMVTKALCGRGGIEYQELGTLVIDKYGTTDLLSGEVYCLETRSCGIRLRFKVVFLAIVLRVSHARDPTEWKRHTEDLYLTVLQEAEKQKLQSVAIPLLGSGRAGAPIDVAVDALVQALNTFQPGSLRRVLVVSFQEEVHLQIVHQCERLFSEQTASEKQLPVTDSGDFRQESLEGSTTHGHPPTSDIGNSRMTARESRSSGCDVNGSWITNREKRGSSSQLEQQAKSTSHGSSSQLVDDRTEQLSKSTSHGSSSQLEQQSKSTSHGSSSQLVDDRTDQLSKSTSHGSSSQLVDDRTEHQSKSTSHGLRKQCPSEEMMSQRQFEASVSVNEQARLDMKAAVESHSSLDDAKGVQNSEVTTGKTKEQASASASTPEEPDSCAICMDEITDPKRLSKCGHTFCAECIDNCFTNFKPVCPTCNTVYGVLTGNQPPGTMSDRVMSNVSCAGYEGDGVIVIDYYFQDGIQTDGHPNPGKPYHGTRRRGFLPDTPDGRSILRLLKIAFDQKLTFTVGQSTTTGRENMVTWNDIHHKTNTHGGPTRFGYPDPTYLSRVREELSSKGVSE